MYYSNSSFTVALLVLLTEDIVRQAVKLCMIINPQTIIFSMLKNLGTMGSKNWVALYLQMHSFLQKKKELVCGCINI